MRDGDGQIDAEKEVQEDVVLAIVLDNGITHEVRVVDGRAFDDDVRMFSGQKPSHVSEKAAAARVVRICVCFGELVVQAMVS